MIRLLLALALLALAAGLAAWLADSPGAVSILWRGWRIETSVAVLAVAAGGLTLAGAGLVWLVGALARGLGLSPAARAERRRRQGFAAVSRGLVALAAGDPAEARRQARRAERLLPDSPLSLLLVAQAAQLAGQDAAARASFAAMLEHPETAFLALRGLLAMALKGGDLATARRLARRALALRPGARWVAEVLAELQVQAGEWGAAADTLRRAARHHALPPPEAAGKRAAALFGQAERAAAAGRPGEALGLLRRAHRLAPGHVPVAAALARALAAAGERGRAEKLLIRAWATGPHPDLARAFAELVPEEAPLARARRIERLVRGRPDHPESHLALGEAALAAGLWGLARGHLKAALAAAGEGPVRRRRIAQLLAAVEAGEGNAAAAREWEAEAAAAEPDPAWVCRRCGTVAPGWAPLCPRCGGFDSLAWERPDRARLLARTGEAAGPAPPALAGAGAAARPSAIPAPPGAVVDAASRWE